MFTLKASGIIVFVLYIPFVYLFCVDIDALNNVKATVHSKRSMGSLKYNGNMYLLDKEEVIDIIQANVTELCEDMIKNFPKLKVLTLVNVNLTKIQPNAFSHVPKLRELSLSVNYLTEIENGNFNNIPALEILYLSGNNIKTIGGKAFQNLSNLKKIHLDRNQLTSLEPDVFSGSSKLMLLDLRFNLFQTIEKNNFPELHPSFTYAVTVLLNSNNIDDVNPSVFTFNNPISLNLHKNKLGTISNLFHGLKDYSSLNLDENQLSCLPDDVMENLKNTTKNVSIKNNPITCECVTNIENSLGDGQELVGVGSLEYSTVFPCDFARKISFD